MAIDYTSIDEVVNDIQLLMDDTSYDNEAQIYQLRLLALQGLRELKFDAEQEVKTAEMFVSSTTLKCDLPSDFVKLIKIGYKNSDDEFVSLGYKSNLSLDAIVNSQISEDPYDENNPYFHTDMGRKYGVGGGQNALGYYRLNRNDNTINFSSDVAGKTVFIEYISDGIGSTQPRDHIIRLEFNTATGSAADKIVPSCILEIPKPDSSASFQFFAFNSTFSVGDNAAISAAGVSTGIQITPNDNAATVAQKFTSLINNGYPSDNVGPYNSKITASQELGSNSAFVNLTYKDITAIPRRLELSNFNFSQTVQGTTGSVTATVIKSHKLVQLGVVGSDPRVHKFCEEALRCYIYYKYIQRKRGIPANEKQMAKRAYYNEKRLARARMMNFNKEAAMQTSRKAFKQSPKI
jgi:hypothetical protein